jgi:hypothetical protein
VPGPSLKLEAVNCTDADRWRWILKGPNDVFLEDFPVTLDRTCPEYRALYDLPGYLHHYASSDNREQDERRLLGDIGAWIGANVLGEPIAKKIIQYGLTPIVVRVVIPSSTSHLLVLPLELAHAEGRPIGAQGISLIFDIAEDRSFDVAPIGQHLRILALFSLPPADSPLNLRRERQMLRSLVRRLLGATGLSIELEVMQYGVTQKSLRDKLTTGGGWDVIHFSGHGLPGLLKLEKPDGSADPISSTALAELLRESGQRLKLVVLSACHSAAATIEQTLSWLGINAPSIRMNDDTPDSEGSRGAPMVARTLIGSLGCAVVAMRYAVEDEFAASFGAQLYEALFERQQPLMRAVQHAVSRALAQGSAEPLSSITPVLFGRTAADLQLIPPPRQPGFRVKDVSLVYFDPESAHFVGRVSSMTRASAALAAESGKRGVLFHGMAGAGKTSCAVELAYHHQRASRFMAFVWYRAPDFGKDISLELRNFALAMEKQLPDFSMMHVVNDKDTLARWLPKLTDTLATSAALIMLDNLESLLLPSGEWRDERWKLLIDALCRPGGLSRVVLTSQIPPLDLPTAIESIAVNWLSLAESVLLVRELPNLRGLLDGTVPGIGVSAGRGLLWQVLRMVQGHPKLIEFADRLAGDSHRLQDQINRSINATSSGAGNLDTFFETGETSLDATAFLESVRTWVNGIVVTLPEEDRIFFHFLCALEDSDRESEIIAATWAEAWQRLGRSDAVPEPTGTVSRLAAVALVVKQPPRTSDTLEANDIAFIVEIHPAVADAERAQAGSAFQATVDAVMAAHWDAELTEGLESFGQRPTAGKQIARAGLQALPYLIRTGNWGGAGTIVEQVYHIEDSPGTVAALLPIMRRIGEETTGTWREHIDKYSLGRLLRLAGQTREAEERLRAIVGHADGEIEATILHSSWMELASLLADTGRLQEALRATEKRMEYARARWDELGAAVQRLQMLNRLGNYEKVLDQVPRLAAEVNAAPAPKLRELTLAWNVKETLLDQASSAALELGRKIAQENAPRGTIVMMSDSQRMRAHREWQRSIDFNAENLRSKQQRGASSLELARARFNDYAALSLMHRLDEARALLTGCRTVFEDHNSVPDLGLLFSALSTVEGYDENVREGRRFEEMALRYKYTDGDPAKVWVSHFNLASRILEHGGEPEEGLAHRLAAVLLAMVSQSMRTANFLAQLKADIQHIGKPGREALPESFAALCDTLKRVPGVRFEEMLEALAPGSDDRLLQRVLSQLAHP